ncbi:hypothetical protein DdX_16333 [Ditylenchus destructor]|uniref:F-box domain-containing protein n=1 Tax=Ditylenchus destructor TaxID=166010 RepID=A0AAD4QU34_9BILA|nr:hypothetical protein DdX_16333 [Ditylenchus destructor]
MRTLPYFLAEILRFLTRRELYKASFANKCFQNMIEQGFGNAPYLDKTVLNGSKNVSSEFVSRLPQLTFLRFETSSFDLHSNQNLLDFLEPLKHLWQGQVGITVSKASIEASAELARVVSSCSRVILDGDGSMDMLRHLPSLKGYELILHDMSYSPKMELPISDMIEFLFGPAELMRRIVFVTNEKLNLENYRSLLSAVKQRFLDVDKQHAFECMWCHNVSNGREYVPFELPHPNNDMTLFLELNTIESGFRLCTKDPNDDSSSLYLALSSEDVSIASAEPAEPVETYQE